MDVGQLDLVLSPGTAVKIKNVLLRLMEALTLFCSWLDTSQ